MSAVLEFFVITQLNATQLQHLYKKPRDGFKPPKVILKKGVLGGT